MTKHEKHEKDEKAAKHAEPAVKQAWYLPTESQEPVPADVLEETVQTADGDLDPIRAKLQLYDTAGGGYEKWAPFARLGKDGERIPGTYNYEAPAQQSIDLGSLEGPKTEMPKPVGPPAPTKTDDDDA